jgi:hypothetical protein
VPFFGPLGGVGAQTVAQRQHLDFSDNRDRLRAGRCYGKQRRSPSFIRGQRALEDHWLTNHAALPRWQIAMTSREGPGAAQVVSPTPTLSVTCGGDARTEAAIVAGSAMECDFSMARRRPGS